MVISGLFLSLPAFAWDRIAFTITRPANAPYSIGQPEINIDAEEFTTLILKIKASKSGAARLFWASSYDPQMNEPKSLRFFLNKSDYPKEYVFNVKSQNPYWLGFIGQILIYPENGPEGIGIEEATAVPGNFMTNVKSGWREFWGPRGRLVIGSTINTIQSSNLFGRPIFVYLYWLAGIIIAGFFVFAAGLAQTGKIAFITVVIFWGLLEVSGLFNNYLEIKDNWRFFGKSFEEKLELANTGDFYSFMRFCMENIPPQAAFDMRIPPLYNDIKARYYLYPRKYEKEAKYLVVYDMNLEEGMAVKYSLWKNFRGGAYIMKKCRMPNS
ncbi:hypothetical protein HZB08_01590 [Candidatus Saganbacteria bacterium]|uniref:Uncharacterized protein n=1 Tax=Candidatus Saganbacteria bacterium TaxID=2575572 RepID=A0A9D6UJU8_UNCSA|nr:hypothetical protein [Candidatus Saganbacteria bacterium]